MNRTYYYPIRLNGKPHRLPLGFDLRAQKTTVQRREAYRKLRRMTVAALTPQEPIPCTGYDSREGWLIDYANGFSTE